MRIEPVTQRARELRRKQIDAEEVLWQRVRNSRAGWKIVRQKPIMIDYFGNKRAFVADFYCSEGRLVIEIDGSVHAVKLDYDSLRTFLMNQKGLRLIRFTNREVKDSIDEVVRRIRDTLASPPHPSVPSPRVERGRRAACVSVCARQR
jgi:very-short-patch-repair endonuclease